MAAQPNDFTEQAMHLRRPSIARPLIGASLLAAAVAACGSNHSTGPSSSANVAGTWAYSATTTSSGVISCTVAATLTFTQTAGASTFGGSFSDGTISCTTPDGPVTETDQSGSVLNGTIHNTTVAFELGDTSYHNSGTLASGSITGTASITQTIGASTYTLNGTFTATQN
jgi:hypothetical protein